MTSTPENTKDGEIDSLKLIKCDHFSKIIRHHLKVLEMKHCFSKAINLLKIETVINYKL